MNLGNIMPSERNQTQKTNMVSVHLYEICKINKSKETGVGEWVSETRRKGE